MQRPFGGPMTPHRETRSVAHNKVTGVVALDHTHSLTSDASTMIFNKNPPFLFFTHILDIPHGLLRSRALGPMASGGVEDGVLQDAMNLRGQVARCNICTAISGMYRLFSRWVLRSNRSGAAGLCACMFYTPSIRPPPLLPRPLPHPV